jgi:PAS domain-containing protein
MPDRQLMRRAWQSILDVVPMAAYSCDTEGRITYFNQRAGAVWGRSVRLLDRRTRFCGSQRLYSAGGAPMRHDECWMARALFEDRSYNGRGVQIGRPDGSRIQGLAHANPVHNSEGRVIAAVNLIAEVPGPDMLAIVAVALGVLAGLRWPVIAFSWGRHRSQLPRYRHAIQ